MRFPKELQNKDLIGLVAPSSPTSAARTLKCKEFVEKMGYDVILGKSCMKCLHGYLAGNRYERAADINEMFTNPQVKGIFCIRGGYGSSEIMDLLDYDRISQNPKVFVGYSDITNLNVAFQTKCDFITFHGPMVSSNMLEHYDDYTKACFFQALHMKEEFFFHNPQNEPFTTIVHGSAKGIIVGGNLAVFMNLLGTFYAPNLKGKILFIEDINESVPRVHRMLEQLRYLGIFDQIAGILIGDFLDCFNQEDETFQLIDLVTEFFAQSKIPVVANIKCGHCFPTATIPMVAVCEIDTKRELIKFSLMEKI